MKKCSKCEKRLPKTKKYFGTYKKGKSIYFRSWCKQCTNKQALKKYNENPIPRREYHRNFIKTPSGIFSQLHKEKHSIIISREDFIIWYNQQNKMCIYCGLKEEDLHKIKDAHNNNSTRLTIDRIDSSKEYEQNNLVLACSKCNLIKNDLFGFDEMKEIGRKYISPKWKAQGIDYL